MNKEDYINKSKPEFLNMPKYLKKILNGTDEKQYERVLLEWSKKLSSSKWNKKLLAIAIMTKCPLDYINAMKVFPDG